MKAIVKSAPVFLAVFLLAQAVCADTEVINLKSDSTWKASSSISSTEWFKLDYDDSSWGISSGRWLNNPCAKYCGKMNSCELTCIEWMWFNQSCQNCETYYRKTINLPDEIMIATLVVTADKYYWLYVNGNYVGSDTRKIGYTNTETYDITKYILPGKNVIAIKAQSEGDTEGVAVAGEIKYQSYDTLVNQLQVQIDSLEAQVNTLNNDKSRLQEQADALQTQNTELSTAKDQLTAENSQLKLENSELKNTNSEQAQSLSSATSSMNFHKTLNMVLILALLLSLGILVASLYYFYDKMKGRKPRLVVPEKKLPTEKVVFEKSDTHLTATPVESKPVFERSKETTLGKR